jgi:HSP20 family molecular chaperone IbpA
MALLRTRPPVRIEREGDAARLVLELGFATRQDVELMQHGDELVVEMGGSRRNLLLPGALARMRAARARVESGELVIEFESAGAAAATEGTP